MTPGSWEQNGQKGEGAGDQKAGSRGGNKTYLKALP